MSERFFVERPIDSDRATLSGPEAHHLIHVMRAAAGTEVVLFDGSGTEMTARVEQVGRSEVQLAILSRRQVDREAKRHATLGVSLPKGDRQRWLVEKAVELGLTRLVPLKTQRGVAQPNEKALLRLRRTVIEASKQCGRNRLLEIADPQTFNEFVASAPSNAVRILAHPAGEKPAAESLRAIDDASSTALFLAVGPEGGFTDDETAIAQAANWRSVHLGPRTLRIETAAIALIALAMEL